MSQRDALFPASGGCACPALQPPSLENQTATQWAMHQEVAYVLARHVRHDMVNVQCVLQLCDVMEMLEASGGELPPELQPALVQTKIKGAIRQLTHMGSDLVYLSQAANQVAYRKGSILALADLFQAAWSNRLASDGPLPPHLMDASLRAGRLVVMGDLLQAALAACCFQWSAALHPAQGLEHITARCEERALDLCFAPLDREALGGFARRLRLVGPQPPHPAVEAGPGISTTELALWMARFIVVLHGGTLAIDADDPDLKLHVRLPLAGG